jgi:hypothetical protein
MYSVCTRDTLWFVPRLAARLCTGECDCIIAGPQVCTELAVLYDLYTFCQFVLLGLFVHGFHDNICVIFHSLIFIVAISIFANYKESSICQICL